MIEAPAEGAAGDPSGRNESAVPVGPRSLRFGVVADAMSSGLSPARDLVRRQSTRSHPAAATIAGRPARDHGRFSALAVKVMVQPDVSQKLAMVPVIWMAAVEVVSEAKLVGATRVKLAVGWMLSLVVG